MKGTDLDKQNFILAFYASSFPPISCDFYSHLFRLQLRPVVAEKRKKDEPPLRDPRSTLAHHRRQRRSARLRCVSSSLRCRGRHDCRRLGTHRYACGRRRLRSLPSRLRRSSHRADPIADNSERALNMSNSLYLAMYLSAFIATLTSNKLFFDK